MLTVPQTVVLPLHHRHHESKVLLFFRRLSAMIISTTNNTLCNLFVQPFKTGTMTYHLRDSHYLLASDMVEIENYYVIFSTFHTRVRFQVIKHMSLIPSYTLLLAELSGFWVGSVA